MPVVITTIVIHTCLNVGCWSIRSLVEADGLVTILHQPKEE